MMTATAHHFTATPELKARGLDPVHVFCSTCTKSCAKARVWAGTLRFYKERGFKEYSLLLRERMRFLHLCRILAAGGTGG